MITFKLTEKNNRLLEICQALKCFKNISVTEISENLVLVKMPIDYFEVFSHTIEYYGIIYIL